MEKIATIGERIAIIGPPGAGKTTLARELNRIHNIKVYHLDRIFWERGWKWKHREIKKDILNKFVGEKQWIIEGSYLKCSEPLLEAADTIIFLDMPPLLCLYRLLERHHKQHECSNRDIPLECTHKLDLKLILRLFSFPFQDRKLLMPQLKEYEKTKLIHLRSPEGVRTFLESFADIGAIPATKASYKQQKALLHYNYGVEGKVLVGSKW